ncbi:YtxH domain-containing protein [Oceanobacillus senegalensis]|uniref:YtxH domain-containing protein n=1 Tax=Oceanobacillus senegalensis TaxID=1936063 RepID=UPI000A30C9D2|nr:YtxH domain-containing protein [Oceanobacillus senegalensis]
MSESNIDTKDFVIGTLVGTIVGASVALIFAPKSGKELRGDINQGAIQVKDRAGDWKEIAQEKGTNWKEKAFTTSADFKQRAMDTSSKITKNVSQKTQNITKNLSTKLSDEQNDANATIENVAETEEEKQVTEEAK